MAQQQIIDNAGFMGVGVNEKALPIVQLPPWSWSQLSSKYDVALKSMMSYHNIREGHKWKKRDRVKALYDYGLTQAAAPVPLLQPRPAVDPS